MSNAALVGQGERYAFHLLTASLNTALGSLKGDFALTGGEGGISAEQSAGVLAKRLLAEETDIAVRRIMFMLLRPQLICARDHVFPRRRADARDLVVLELRCTRARKLTCCGDE